MNLKKTWISYGIWGLFSAILFISIGYCAINVAINNSQNDYTVFLLMNYGIVLGIAIVCWLIARLIFSKLKDKFGESDFKVNKYIEIGVFVVVILIACLVRLIAIVSTAGQISGDSLYFDIACKTQPCILNSVANLPYVYINVLSFFLSFLGNIGYAAMGFQAFLQILLIIFAFWYISMAHGKIPAWITVLALSFIPSSYNLCRYVNPDIFLCLFVCVYLLALTLLCEANKAGVIQHKWQTIFYILLGIFNAFICYLDMIGIPLMIVSLIFFVADKCEDCWINIQKPLCQIIVHIVSILGGLMWLLMSFSLNGEPDKAGRLVIYARSFVPDSGFNMSITIPFTNNIEAVIIYGMSLIWLIVFLKAKYDKAVSFITLIVFSTVFMCLGYNVSSYNQLGIVSWIGVAAMGLTNFLYLSNIGMTEEQKVQFKKEKEKKRIAREERQAIAKGEKTISLKNDLYDNSHNSTFDDVDKTNTEILNTKKEESQKNINDTEITKMNSIDNTPNASVNGPRVMPILGNEAAKNVEKIKNDSIINTSNEKPEDKTQMLKNPLPLPKKHVSKEMDYDYDVKDDQMHYDILNLSGHEYYDI